MGLKAAFAMNVRGEKFALGGGGKSAKHGAVCLKTAKKKT